MPEFINSPSNVIYNRIKITICDPKNGYIEGIDMYNQSIRLAYSFYHSPYVQVPRINESWIVKKIDNNWNLYARFESEDQINNIADLSPGDVRIESKNILYINADQEILLDFNKAAPSLKNLEENTLPGTALFGSGTLNQFSAGTLITTDKFITPLKNSLSTANVSDGQEERVLISENDIVWNFRYREDAPTPYKWDFIGGPEYMSFRPGTVSTFGLGTAWANTSGTPVMTVPYSGDYIISGGAEAESASNNVEYELGLSVNGTVLATLPGYIAKSNQPFTTSTSYKLDANTIELSQGDVLREVYRSPTGSTILFDLAWMKMHPIRVQAT